MTTQIMTEQEQIQQRVQRLTEQVGYWRKVEETTTNKREKIEAKNFRMEGERILAKVQAVYIEVCNRTK